MEYFQELIKWIKENKPDKQKIAQYKLQLCKKHKRKHIPTDIEIYMHASEEDAPIIRPLLETKPTRTSSGVAIIATMTKPIACPHGKCIYCPGGPESAYGDTPQSYTGTEPCTMRGIRNEFDPYRMIFNRLEQYVLIGQNNDKVDQIIMGGTFPSFPKEYQEEFAYYSFKAYNDFSKLFYKDGKLELNCFREFFELPGSVADKQRAENIKKKVLELKDKNKKSLEEEQVRNETAAIRCIGLTIETRPDYGLKKQGLEFLRLGATRVELGVQTVYDDILKTVNRGHTLKETKKSISELRDLGFKMNFHMMPGLPEPDFRRISRNKDIESIKTIFSNPDFRPDMIKIYPCMVMSGTPLKKKHDDGIFKPLNTEEAADIIVESFRYIPEYCRVMRVQRDVPTKSTEAGVDRTNLRQYVAKLAKERGIKLRDIRTREIGRGEIKTKPDIAVRDYEASNGKEYFISMEADDKVLGFARMRFPPRSLHPAITENSALIRELHVYGQAVVIGGYEDDKTQHKGYGKQLMAKAEEIAKKEGRDKMVVISGVGAREYYRKLGYEREGPYMVKKL